VATHTIHNAASRRAGSGREQSYCAEEWLRHPLLGAVPFFDLAHFLLWSVGLNWRQGSSIMQNLRPVLVLLLACLYGAPAGAVPAPRDVVMYEVNLRAFSEAGDLAGVTARLDEIQALGANTLWLMPIHPIGQIEMKGELGSPYSVADYGAVSSEYGALADLTTLVDQAHQRGMYVLMDWVANHTAWDNPWITNTDWYTQDAQGEIIHPAGTNWTDVADLNYNNQAMRSAMIGEMQYWVSQVGIDGYRADAADWVPFDFWQQAIPAVRSSTTRPLLMLAEGGRNDHYAAGFDMTFGWNFYNTVKSVFIYGSSATDLYATHDAVFDNVPAGNSVLSFTTNHDESAWDATPVQLFGGLDASLAAYAVTVAYGGTPLVYNGQEIGWDQIVPFFSKTPLDWTTGQDTADWYAQLLGIRADHPAMREGTLTDQSTSEVAVLMREYGGDQVITMVNTRNSSRFVFVPDEWQGVWFDLFTGLERDLTLSQFLAPHEVLILGKTAGLFGDLDGDGFVGIADLNMILGNWNQTVPPGDPLADVSGDGFIGIEDLNIVLGNWNAGTPPGDASTHIPEPGTVAAMGLVGLTLIRRRPA
jgi:alpha-amylase